MTLLHPVKLYWSQNAASREVIALLSIEYKAATCSWTSSKNTNYMYIEYACMSLMSISFTKYSDKYWVTDFFPNRMSITGFIASCHHNPASQWPNYRVVTHRLGKQSSIQWAWFLLKIVLACWCMLDNVRIILEWAHWQGSLSAEWVGYNLQTVLGPMLKRLHPLYGMLYFSCGYPTEWKPLKCHCNYEFV